MVTTDGSRSSAGGTGGPGPPDPAPVFDDPFAPEHRADPYPIFAEVRETAPVYRSLDGTWVLSRYADALGVLRDARRFSSSPENLRGEAARAQADNPIRQAGTSVMMFIDPPDHTRLRGLVATAFTPRRVEQLRDRVRALVDDLLDARLPEGELDVVGDLGHPLPVSVICELLGVPDADDATFRTLSAQASRLLDGPSLPPEVMDEGMVAGMQLFQYFTDLIEARRAEPADDLLSALIATEEEGERLSHPELVTTATLLFVAGHETTTNQIGNAVLALLRHPAELARLRHDPSLLRPATEEFLRWDPAVQFAARITTGDVTVGGVDIAAGEQVAVLIGAVNRDPAQFADPETLDLGRTENRHLTFASGAHFCLGAALARLEIQVAVERLVARCAHWELLEEPTYREHYVLRGVDALRMGFTPA